VNMGPVLLYYYNSGIHGQSLPAAKRVFHKHSSRLQAVSYFPLLEPNLGLFDTAGYFVYWTQLGILSIWHSWVFGIFDTAGYLVYLRQLGI